MTTILTQGGFAGYQVSSMGSGFNSGLSALKQGVGQGVNQLTSKALGKGEANIKTQYKGLGKD